MYEFIIHYLEIDLKTGKALEKIVELDGACTACIRKKFPVIYADNEDFKYEIQSISVKRNA